MFVYLSAFFIHYLRVLPRLNILTHLHFAPHGISYYAPGCQNVAHCWLVSTWRRAPLLATFVLSSLSSNMLASLWLFFLLSLPAVTVIPPSRVEDPWPAWCDHAALILVVYFSEAPPLRPLVFVSSQLSFPLSLVWRTVSGWQMCKLQRNNTHSHSPNCLVLYFLKGGRDTLSLSLALSLSLSLSLSRSLSLSLSLSLCVSLTKRWDSRI